MISQPKYTFAGKPLIRHWVPAETGTIGISPTFPYGGISFRARVAC
jgi:hypothetical protein